MARTYSLFGSGRTLGDVARGRLDTLSIAAIAFFAANMLHTWDHQRQGTPRLTTEIYVGGSVITALGIVTLVWALRRNPQAPLVATVVGFWTAVGVTASHILPHWSAFSDPYPDLNVDALSWVIVLLEIGAALALGVVGARELRAGRLSASRTA
jgi:hypothetical protein